MNLHNPELWVSTAFVLFVALSYKKVANFAARALDERSAKIKLELDEARALREEGEKLLAEYKKKQAQYLQEAEAMLKRAREDASHFGTLAEQDLKIAMDDRTKQALEKIALAEEKAIQDVRNHVVDIALAAARAIIIEHVGTMPQDELLTLALSDIERKIH
jgi:F-type H+-transporting ATPase subunit b